MGILLINLTMNLVKYDDFQRIFSEERSVNFL